jgi:UDP-glucose 4-epimerase
MKSYEGLNILVTGGRGYIGSALVESLNSIDCNLILSIGDVSEKETWDSIIHKDIDVIFHLAGVEVGHETSERDLNVNAVSVLHMLQTCVEKDCNPRIVFSSSTNIFGDTQYDVVDEKTISNPPAEWSAHKLLAENYLKIYSDKYGLKTVTLRLPNVYGPVPRKEVMSRMVINKVIQYGIENKQLKLYKNKDCYRDYIFVDDVVNAFLKIGLADSGVFDGRFFVVGTEKLITISKVWNTIANEIGNVSISIDNSVELNPIEMRSFGGDSTRLNEVVGWEPEINLQYGIRLTVENIKRRR